MSTAKKKVVAKTETPSPTTNKVTSLKFYKTNEEAQLPTPTATTATADT